jgi:acetoin utilization deacetylase AcuC-like enzyme
MRVFTTDRFVLPLPPEHRFPMLKYRLLRERVEASGLVPAERMTPPHAASDDELLLAHDPEYLRRVVAGDLTEPEVRRIGFPWSVEMVERCRRSTGATIDAARAALEDGVAVNLAGGTHHAFRDAGEGFCVFNDAAVAARVMQRQGRIRRVALIDADVHQGNGSAAILAGDETVFTYSIHGARNFPYRKEVSDLDVALDDGTGDDAYLAAFADGLEQTLELSRPDLLIYLAGADPFAEDRFGRLKLSKAGLAERDRRFFERARRAGLPVAVTMAGGYAPNVEDIVDIHFETVRLAAGLARA